MGAHGDGTSSHSMKRERMSRRGRPGTNDRREKGDDPSSTPYEQDDIFNAKIRPSTTIEGSISADDGGAPAFGGASSKRDVVSEGLSLNNSPVADVSKESCDDKSSQPQNLVWIKIESSNVEVSPSFCIPVPFIWKRELEMQAAARENKIGKERWTSSRIFRMWKSQCERQQGMQKNQTLYERELKNPDSSSEMVLRMTPEISLRNSNSSCRLFRWKPWLTTCISSYYNTGSLRIPDECTGDDILLTLEYFGILTTSPKTFLFESRSPYVRTQSWSRYFTHRAHLAESFLEAYDNAEIKEWRGQNERPNQTESLSSRTNHLAWVLFKENEYDERDRFCVVREASSSPETGFEKEISDTRDGIMILTVNSTGGLYDLFLGKKQSRCLGDRECTTCNEEDSEANTNFAWQEMSSRMCQDFCEHLTRSLPPWISVQFDIEQVEVIITDTTKERHLGPRSQSRPIIRLYHNQLHASSKSIPNTETGSSVTIHLKSVQESEDNEATNPDAPSGAVDSSGSSIHNKNDTYFNVDKKDWSKKTGSDFDNRDYESRSTFFSADAINQLNSKEKQKYNKARQFHEPIPYINTDLGDLRSVTSGLSVPLLSDDQRNSNEMSRERGSIERTSGEGQFQDESTVLAIAKRIIRKRTEQRSERTQNVIERKRSESSSPLFDDPETIKTPPRTTRKIQNIPPWDLDRTVNTVENELRFQELKAKKDRSIAYNEASRIQRVNEYKSTADSETSEWEDDISDPNCKKELTDSHGYWGHFIASMCEAMIPAPSSNTLSSSPTRSFEFSSKKGSMPRASLNDDEQKISHKVKKKVEIEPRAGLVGQAKRVGYDLSNHFDELMRKVYHEEIPTTLAINTDEDLTLASCLTSSVIGHQCMNQTPEYLENSRVMKGRTNSKKTSKDAPYDIPKSRSFESDSLKMKAGVLPNRTNEGRFSQLARGRQEVSRNKEKARDFAAKENIPKVVKSSNSTKKERNRISSVRKTTSGYPANDYSKENRYSQRENRFYS